MNKMRTAIKRQNKLKIHYRSLTNLSGKKKESAYLKTGQLIQFEEQKEN